ncbi:MAG: AAA family ATPase [Sphingomonadaceae bacterium]
METGQPASRIEEKPTPSREPPALIVMVGPPGTGKSHLVRLLAQQVPLKVVETDEIRRRLTPHPEYSIQENRRVFAIAHRTIDRFLRQGKDVVFDATNIYEWGRRILHRIAERNGARLLIIRTVAPDEVVKKRLSGRMAGFDPADRSEADWEIYLRMKREFEEIGRPHMVVDTSRDLDRAVAEVVAFIRGKK